MKQQMGFKRILLTTVILTCLAILATNSPAKAQSEGPDAGLISEESGLQINDISLSGNGIHLFVTLPPDMDQPTFLERLLAAMVLATNDVPQADHLTVHLYYLDQPYGVLEVPAQQVRQVDAGIIDGEAFLGSLEFMDQRSPEMQMRDALFDLGIEPTELTVTENEVFVSYFADAYAEKIDLFEDWQFVLNLVANLFPTVQHTSIYIVVPENKTSLAIQVNMDDYQSYQNDEINLLEFITRIQTSYEQPGLPQAVETQPEPQPSPVSSNAGNLWLTLCGGGLLFLSLAAIGIGLYLILSKKAQKWGIVILILLALPACVTGIVLFVIRLAS